MISAFVFEESINIHDAPQDYVVEDVIRQLKSYGVKFAKTSGERCEIFEQVFDQCMGRECMVNALGLRDNEVVFVVRQPTYSTDIAYLDDNELLANDLRRFLPSNEYDVDQTTDDTSRLNVNDNNDFSGDFEGRNNDNSDNQPVNEPEERPNEEPRDRPVEEPTNEPVEEPTERSAEDPTERPEEEPTERPAEEPKEIPNNGPEEIPDPPKDNDDNRISSEKNDEESTN